MNENHEAEKIKESDQYVSELINQSFTMEWNRCNELDTKAGSLIGFVGIIISLELAFGTIFLNYIPKSNNYFIYLLIIYFFGIILFICSILWGLNAYRLRLYSSATNPARLIEYLEDNLEKSEILEIVIATTSETIDENTKLNDKKAQSILYGFLFLLVGIIITVIFMAVLFMVWW